MASAEPGATGRVVAVVVTYNRAGLLRECLDGLAAQTRGVDGVVVIDNASEDGSGDVARAHPIGADVITLSRNVGGAGGFAAGMARALDRHEPDWVWLMDDDTIPKSAALRELVAATSTYPGRLSVVSSTAVWSDGRVHPMNISRRRVRSTRRDLDWAELVGGRPVRTASFVSIMMAAPECRRLGLPLADYFIWGDDTEYSGRLLREGAGVQISGSVVEHRTRMFGSWQSDPGERFYFEVRNKIWAFARSDSFRWWERALYGGSAIRGWVRTVVRSPRRRRLLVIGLRGLRDGIRNGPRPTAQVLSGFGALSDAVVAVERNAQ
jgi:rhamnopyranosyl-N-acetylglucosaminyl-diphospho-decaprenol beta-1,3/1,4-galactofuranosyltransferase